MKIFQLHELPQEEYHRAGGKAQGLAELVRSGLKIADGFVIIGLDTDADYEAASDYYCASGLDAVAVRSSASAEDGEDFSNAGQYSSFLNVRGREAFTEALRNCVRSLNNAHAASYSEFFAQAKSASMSVVVQRMVDAADAGVCFTIDPAAGDKILIEAVPGLGESLVSGQAEAEQIAVPRSLFDAGDNKTAAAGASAGEARAEHISVSGAVLNREQALEIAAGAWQARNYFKGELDLEWAIGRDGELRWLQARPITTLDEAGIDELDTVSADDTTVITTCNIGEMLPGAVTPLSISTSVEAIEYGLRLMMVKAGAYKNLDEIPAGAVVSTYSNHLFFNLTSIYRIATNIMGANKEAVEASICGKNLKDTPPIPWKDAPVPVKVFNSIKYFSLLFSRKKMLGKALKIVGRMHIPYSPDPAVYYKNIDAALQDLIEVTYCHYISSSHSGAMSSAFLQVLAAEGYREDEARAVLAELLEDIENIESVDILASLRRIARRVVKQNPGAIHYSAERLAAYIKADSGAVREAYDYFLKRHGHRGIREAELRSRSWKNDEEGLMENLRTVMMASTLESSPESFKGTSRIESRITEFLKGKKGMARKGLEYLIHQARDGVYNREYTKSKFVMAVDFFKEAYARLADILVDAGALPEADLIYFLQHKEIGELIFERKAKLIKKAVQRRRLLDAQMDVRYNEVYVGKPYPVEPEDQTAENGLVLSGAPISRGEVKGIARVVQSVADARALREGEIMVAAFTDIGWSPYYSIIGGLITEVGSALSHGAVVAREYALPLVANVKDATRIIRTGSLVSLNGSTGVVTILEAAEDCDTEAV
ncbi:MAG: hypothetical protein LBN21_04385 [Treponema sp.]|jgi:pyruvate,water dikinase|nr:hypothetical protein [Treponema sp.]